MNMRTSRKPADASERRRYQSPLRASQAAATRKAILDAALTLLRESPDELTVPRLAARAGISVPTVNRHFPSRQALLEGLVEHLDRSSGAPAPAMPDPRTLLEGDTMSVRPLFEHLQAMNLPDALVGHAAMVELRHKVTIPRRRKLFEQAIASSLPDLGEPHRTWLADLLVVLASSAMAHTLRTYLGLEGAEAAHRVDWAIRALVEGARRVSRETKPKADGSPHGASARRRPRASTTKEKL